MKRRDFIAGGCVVPLVAGAGPLAMAEETVEVHPEKGQTYRDLYWDAQTHIEALESELAELRAHAMIMSKRG